MPSPALQRYDRWPSRAQRWVSAALCQRADQSKRQPIGNSADHPTLDGARQAIDRFCVAFRGLAAIAGV